QGVDARWSVLETGGWRALRDDGTMEESNRSHVTLLDYLDEVPVLEVPARARPRAPYRTRIVYPLRRA
ncbi:MAG: hypothetical protein ACYDBQ_08345, partial [Thermoplasmatota archaeon]